ncbi:MAG TPA: undecaprenyl-diphosphate phosphatase [Bacilli bacterium]
MGALWIAVVIGIVEGLTEFLPVSSTGHMILVGHMIGFYGDKSEVFEIVIQLGAILAVAVLYWRRIVDLFASVVGKKRHAPGIPRLNLLHVIIAIVPVMGLAYLFQDFIKGALFSPETVLIGLVLGGIFMIVAEKKKTAAQTETMDQLTYRQAFLIGLSQILSLWPGFSRSGSTIAGGMLAGASRAVSADFTFLIAIPVMTVATGYELLKNIHAMSMHDFGFFAVGFIVSFIFALLAVASFIRVVQRLSLVYFSYYRFVLAAVVLVYYFVVGF